MSVDVTRHELRQFSTRERFLNEVYIPAEVVVHGTGTDVEEELPILYALTMLLRPAMMVELGTRQGTSTRTLALAAQKVGATFVTIDPVDCRPYLEGVNCIFLQATGEETYAQGLVAPCDLLFLDTDPHTRDQTMMWLETWVKDLLLPGGVAAFHDTIPARPEIQVVDAVRAWISDKPGWIWHELPGTYGLGLLWKPE